MGKVKGNYWRISEDTFKLQIKTRQEQRILEEALPGWQCVCYGYVPKTEEDIYVFQRRFETELDWTKFINCDKINNMIDMREVKND